jgi:enamine deaminase RidA (YjgF/YER057c/UK114 family)
VAEQTEQVLLNLGTILKAAGSSLDHLVKTTIFYANVHAGIYRSGLYAAKSDGQPLTPEGAGTIARLIRRWLLRPFRTSAVRPVS